MRALNVLSLLFYLGVSAAILTVNLGEQAPAQLLLLQPPYHYVPGDLLSEFTGFIFTFLFSLLFFGLSAPLAIAIEAAKQASFFSANKELTISALFSLPNIMASFAAVSLGAAAFEDIEGKKPLEYALSEGFRTLLVAIALFLVVAGVQVLFQNVKLWN